MCYVRSLEVGVPDGANGLLSADVPGLNFNFIDGDFFVIGANCGTCLDTLSHFKPVEQTGFA